LNLPRRHYPAWPGAAHHPFGGRRGPKHASTADLRYLMRRVPLGTQILIHP
jgi:hypothetical protein